MIVADEQVLRGQTAIVTGASGGVGREVARMLVASGAWVGMVGPRESALADAAQEVGAHGIPADVSVPGDVHQVTQYVVELLGEGPDLLVNAVGVFRVRPIAETEPDDFDRQIAVNLRAPFLMVRAFLPLMLKRDAGHVISIGSAAGRVALPGHGAYCAAAFGLRGLHEVLAQEIAGTRVRATLVEPAAADPALADAADPDLPRRGPMLLPEEVARAVLFAASRPRDVEIPIIALRSSAG